MSAELLARSVFVDTSAWYALADTGDRRHDDAARIFFGILERRQRLITTNHVVGETYTLLRVRLGHRAAQEFVHRVRASVRTQRFFVPEAWEEEAEAILAQYSDQDFSYVDATSFVVMRHLDQQTAFTFDNHFVTAGFLLVER